MDASGVTIFGQKSADSYMEAIQGLTKCISDAPHDHTLYIERATNLVKLEKFKEAASDASRAIDLGGGADGYFLLGRSLFSLGRFGDALDALKKGKGMEGQRGSGQIDRFSQWIAWCDERMARLATVEPSAAVSAYEPQPLKGPTAVSLPVKVKHDWYQTETDVIITVLAKNLKPGDVLVNFTTTGLNVCATLPSGDNYSLQLILCHPINDSVSSFKVLSSKIEIKCRKRDAIRWLSLEGDGVSPSVAVTCSSPAVVEDCHPPSYPTSATKRHDWNRLEAELKVEESEEKGEGDAALNQLFQKIYSDGNDEVRRAMNKSFMESGGTVLSTNWKDVGTGKVEVKPPDGVVYKKWDS